LKEAFAKLAMKNTIAFQMTVCFVAIALTLVIKGIKSDKFLNSLHQTFSAAAKTSLNAA